jgi:ATP-dependent DNA helicase RecG
MIPDPVAARALLSEQVERVLSALSSGRPPADLESEKVDLKEEAGRRDRTGGLEPGTPTNAAAVTQLAGEIRCFANTPGGGAIILGVDDKTRDPLGTKLDPEWLRQRLHDLTGIAPAIEEREIRGIRVLVLLIGESAEPVEDPDRRLRWRVGDQCRTVDRAEWWTHRAQRVGVDPMAAPTERRQSDLSRRALAVARDYLRDGDDLETADTDDTQLLTRLGVLRADGLLSQAGVLVLCPSARSLVEISRLDVTGGDVTLRYTHPAGISLLEALQAVETRLDAINGVRPQSRGFVESDHRLLPSRAVREAILNGLTHRDWFQLEPTSVRWIEADDTMEVTSAGGFTGGVTPANALTTRHSRYPALADLFRALRLVDRQGVGVPRMYQTMLAEGHRPPLLEEIAGPRVRTTLVGRPLVPVLARLLAAVEPAPRRRDVRVAVLLDALLRRPFLTDAQVGEVLQCSSDAARLALEAVEECRVEGQPLFEGFLDGWRLGSATARAAAGGRYGPVPADGELLWFRGSGAAAVRRVTALWLEVHSRVTSGEVALLTGMHQPYVSKVLSDLATAGEIVVRGPGKGRAAHFRRLVEPALPPPGPEGS